MPDSRENDQETDWAEKLPPPQHKQPTSWKLSLKCWWARDTTCGHKVEDITLPINHWRDAWTKVVVNGLNWKGKRCSCGASTQILTVLQTGWRILGFPGCLELDISSAWEGTHDWNRSPVTCIWSLSSPWLQGCPSWWEWWGSTLGGPWWCRSPSWTALWPGLCCSPSPVHDTSLGQTKYS